MPLPPSAGAGIGDVDEVDAGADFHRVRSQRLNCGRTFSPSLSNV